MPPGASQRVPPRPRRLKVSGRTALVVLALGLLVLTTAVYWVIVDLKRRGPESLKTQPPVQSEPRP